MGLRPGQTFGKYRIVGLPGQGGLSRVESPARSRQKIDQSLRHAEVCSK
ncbi:hypothetical protein C8E89_101104 [Mycolicibacterium moriokaense]|jgi:hypothetical protein|uniref:Uncharacterized protein n=1 Tax=Mycolicibacterium moriokaense TaxID=39691 RepID=A0A318HRA2_9MYCO|nr:hypothetical protein C8E89_101104 [Mycolicibacterium moriokaense]